jgi:serine/threonine-protein kinase
VLRPGQAFEGYLVEDALGHGGSATVYRAQSAHTGRLVALKVLNPDHRGADESARLKREFDLAQRASHPHVVDVYRRGAVWLTMQLIDGGTVTSLSLIDTKLTAVAQIAAALDHAHKFGVVHCDVKPTNILVHKDFSQGGAVLIDFGVAYAVSEDNRKAARTLLGSLPYLAPEMLRGHAPSAATDEYALACTTVELVTGRTPFVARTAAGLIDHQLHEPPPYLSRTFRWLPRGFDGVLGKGLAKDPELRYPTCSEFAAAVARVFSH